MHISLIFLRTFFVVLSVFFMTTFMVTTRSGPPLGNILTGAGIGLLFGLALISMDLLFKRFNLRSFNIAIVGVFIGYLMGQALLLVFNTVVESTYIKIVLEPQTLDLIKISLLLFGIYLGSVMTLRSADEVHLSIPFIKFALSNQKKKDLILDTSVLADSRILDMAGTGLLDQQLVIPRFLVKELHLQSEVGEEGIKQKAKRSLETVKKLESIPGLELRYSETDFPDVKEPFNKLLKLARFLDANLVTADPSRIQVGNIEGIKIINIHTLSNALKPLMQAGEPIRIKIQRFGKEPNQGVGYLEDGTMVVVNGGGDYINEMIDANVLSVKHTTSGRMIFCNAPDWQV